MAKLFCPNCNTFCDVRNENRVETIPAKGEDIVVNSVVAVCDCCNEDLFDEALESANIDAAFRKYRESHGLLTPSQIIELRERYGLSQRAFSRLLGWGDVTLHRYENGAVQDTAHNNQLLIMQDPRNLKMLFETNGESLPPHVQRDLAARISSLISFDSEPRLSEIIKDMFSREADIYSGFRRFDIERFEAMVLYFCKSYGGVFKTKLLKSIWYADFLNYRENASSISGSRYLHWALGPVPDSYELLLGYMGKLNMIDVDLVPCGDKDNDGELYSSSVDPDISLFSNSELGVLNSIIKEHKDLSGTQLWKKTHKEAAYLKTGRDEFIPYSYAEELLMSSREE